ncbi:hypothetical protein PpBr36_02034 [Pyricularia pennisetigena]|uniref:hypothetical protein n=1 Tax=Pyricularia pennisetigena TaxID=1578925 RepID=UPI0011521484|nr:hypothetical protein PpBr36_02034 [Pyricularia pennisetigena]TLS29146.1 hypothetical protein PpBr36_02034 [Pyricularia pennisetigena]
MRVATAFTTLVGLCAHLASAAPSQPLNMKHTTIPPCHQESERCRLVGPDRRFLIALLSPSLAEIERENIESSCGVPLESWKVETFHVPPMGEDIGCVPAIATFTLPKGHRSEPKICVGNGLTRPFTQVYCVD